MSTTIQTSSPLTRTHQAISPTPTSSSNLISSPNLCSIQPPNSIDLIIQIINTSLKKAASLTDFDIPLGQPHDLTSNFTHFQTTLKDLKNMIWQARSAEIKAAQRE
ncbi:40356_t:CDS:2 [Gigaspora margarita]|uniref:40356_t:CDS:1 n=1 Tax=Gigaspora margarita TaxID=4874 RepID=A0ABN7W202_GIGMA|nr:40356_t:CDS:2 [Gigaspora margarita]